MLDLENRVLCKNNEKEWYITFSNADKKKWVLPKRNMRFYMNIYQPSSLKGRLIKLLLPLLSTSHLICKRLNIKYVRIQLVESVFQEIQIAFKQAGLSYGFFMGTPGVHQKIVIQINKEKNVLGYCKITDSIAVYENFVKESCLLQKLNDLQINGIPNSICVKRVLNDSAGIFIQTTTKTINSITLHHLEQRHVTFITQLCQKTIRMLPYNESGLFRELNYLKIYDDKLMPEIQDAIVRLEDYLIHSRGLYCCTHGDFTPWNTYIEGNKLFVFDWEYAEDAYLPMLDLLHFWTQCCYFEKRMQADKIARAYYIFKRDKFTNWIQWTGYDADMLYIAYLLSMISRTMQRESQLTTSSERIINMWSEVLRLIMIHLS